MEAREIQALLPHRYPFLLVDRVLEVGPDKIVAVKNVSMNEPFFQGHFPNHPVMPGVLIVEALAQAGAVMAARATGFDPATQVVYFMALDKVKFRKQVVPGDQLILEVVPLRKGAAVWKMRGEAKVGGAVVAEAEMLATLGKRGVGPVRRAAALLVLLGCSAGPGGDEVKLGRWKRDAGPPVVIIERGDWTGGPVADEHEPNDAKTPQVIAVPGSVRGRIDADGDVDVYKLVLPTAGTLRVTLTGIDDADLILEAQQPNGELISASDNGPAKTAEGFPNLFVQPGTVHLVIREFVALPKKKGRTAPPPPAKRTAPSQTYTLSVSMGPAPAPGEEREPNDASAFADEISLGQSGRGYIGGRRDVDVWRVPLEGVRDEEALAVDVDAVEGVALKLVIMDGTGATILERKGKSGAAVAVRSVAVREKSPIYFVAVSGDKPNADEPYTIRVAPAALVVDEESEPNDTPENASPLADAPGATSGERVGTLGTGDVDLYRLEPSEGGRRLSVTVTPPATADVELGIVGKDGAALLPAVNVGKKGAVEQIDGLPVPGGAEVFVKVVGKGGGDTERYRLRWVVSAAE